MQIYPAIDVRDGSIARARGAEGRGESIYCIDPVAQAQEFVQRGASWLHVVDMDRALRTGLDNTEIVGRIAALDNVSVQLGGNLDSIGPVRDAIHLNVSRIVLGTAAALVPGLLERLVYETGSQRVALAIETIRGQPVLRGESGPAGTGAEELVDMAQSVGVATFVYRDLGRDGTVAGADIAGASALGSSGADVIVAGGIAGLDEIRAARDAGLAGVIVGRALYVGKFTLEEALRCSS